LCVGARADADMEISAPKSEILFCRKRVITEPIVAQDYADLELKHKCKHCGRGFDTRHSRNIHQSSHCKRRGEEYFEEEFEVDELGDVRGPPEHRFYLVMWQGFTEGTWTGGSDMADPKNWDPKFVDTLIRSSGVIQGWRTAPCLGEMVNTGVFSAISCSRLTGPVRWGHLTRGCDTDARAKAGTRAEKLVLKIKQERVQEAAGVVMMGDKRLKNVNVFKYLGFLLSFEADGVRLGALE
jgi:hypothetical protein